MRTITKKDAKKSLRELVKKKGPDFTYTEPAGKNACFYQYRGKPHCGVGVVLNQFGVPIDVLKKIDNCGSASISSPEAADLLKKSGFSLSVGARDVLQEFQVNQDRSIDYQTALERALDQ